MPKKVHVKKGDEVVIISGKEKGEKGKILMVIPDKSKVVVEGKNIVVKHKKARRAGEPGGRINQEAPIAASNVMLICTKCKSATRIGKTFLDDGSKVRVCKKCGAVIDK
ncbi:MAG: 50S ribosomal protein L24 [Christensenellales bacterium]|jgi:large subunit ribosomal protein L24